MLCNLLRKWLLCFQIELLIFLETYVSIKLSFKTRYCWSSLGLKGSFLNWVKGGTVYCTYPYYWRSLSQYFANEKIHLLQAGDVLLGKSHYIKLNTEFKHLLLSFFVTWYILGSLVCQMCLLKLRFSACSCKVLFNFPFGKPLSCDLVNHKRRKSASRVWKSVKK